MFGDPNRTQLTQDQINEGIRIVSEMAEAVKQIPSLPVIKPDGYKPFLGLDILMND
jgi:hypothetical protein